MRARGPAEGDLVWLLRHSAASVCRFSAARSRSQAHRLLVYRQRPLPVKILTPVRRSRRGVGVTAPPERRPRRVHGAASARGSLQRACWRWLLLEHPWAFRRGRGGSGRSFSGLAPLVSGAELGQASVCAKGTAAPQFYEPVALTRAQRGSVCERRMTLARRCRRVELFGFVQDAGLRLMHLGVPPLSS